MFRASITLIFWWVMILVSGARAEDSDTGQRPGDCSIDINSVTVQRADTFLSLPVRGLDPSLAAYESASNQLHPDILFAPDGWPPHDSLVPPWRYWLAVTPMVTSEKEENPHLFASQDGLDWTYRIGHSDADSIINPVFTAASFSLAAVYWFGNDRDDAFYDTTDGSHDSVTYQIPGRHLSDNDIFIDAANRLWLVFRVIYTISGVDMSAIYASCSHNGLTWSPPVRITHLGRFMSPAVVRESDSAYGMYVTAQADYVSDIADKYTVHKFHSAVIDTFWQYDGAMRIIPFKGYPWHIDVLPMYCGRLYMVICAKARAVLWLAISYDNGHHWIVAEQPFLKSNPDKTAWDAIVYRASGQWIDDSECPAIELYYSSFRLEGDSQAFDWHTGRTTVHFICE